MLRQARELLWMIHEHLQATRFVDKHVVELNDRLDTRLRQVESHLVQLARAQSIVSSQRYSDPRHLVHFERQVFSQSGEDGILTEIFSRIGTRSRYFVEFGAGDGLENNTAFLLCQGWRGVWIEGDAVSANGIRAGLAALIETKRLAFSERFVTAATIAESFRDLAVPGEFDVLSIDIDGNDYWVWNALHEYRPRVVVIEYNAIFPPGVKWTIIENPEHRWDGSGYQGASLSALEDLAALRGYQLVACSKNGANAFFVRSDLISDAFCGPFNSERFYEPPDYDSLPKPGHRRTFPMLVAGAMQADREGFTR